MDNIKINCMLYILSNDYSVTVFLLFGAIFQKCMNIALHISYYAGIMLNAFSDPLYWHNRLVPTYM